MRWRSDNVMVWLRILIWGGLCIGWAPGSRAEPLAFTGVNLAGAEFGSGFLPGTFGTNYIYPNQAEVDYVQSKGMNVVRLPFRWERLQPALYGSFDAAEQARLVSFAGATTAKGVYVILDPHNYARYHGDVIGSAEVPIPAFADFWARLAGILGNQDRVWFGLMNEPHTMSSEIWRDAANAAIAAIRSAGAGNLILVPGNGWSGAHSWGKSWYGTPNAVRMLEIVDPGENYAFEVHQYLDGNSSGSTSDIVRETIGAERLTGFTQWLHEHQRRGFLGEFGVANATVGEGEGDIGDEAIRHLLAHMEANAGVWLGWTWWAAGPWWGEYRFTLEPTDGGADRPTMGALLDHIPIPRPELERVGPDQWEFLARTGFDYQPETSTNLRVPDWVDRGTPVTGDGQPIVIDLDASPSPSFHRVRVSRSP